MKNAWTSLGLGALVILLTVVAYIPSMRGGFVWDDVLLVTDNPLVRADDGLYRIWFTTEPMDYNPLTWSLWWLGWHLWGNNAFGYHAVNVSLHAANSVLVWMILRWLKVPGAWLAGLVFALHPVNVASVAWVSEQKNTLSMFFYLTAILFYLRFLKEDRDPRTVVWGWYVLSLVSFLLALFSKSAAVMLPVTLLGCAWWLRGRLRMKDLLCSAPFFALALVTGLVTIWFHGGEAGNSSPGEMSWVPRLVAFLFHQHRILEGYVARTEGFLPRLAAAGWAPWFYLYKALLPVGLTAIYPKWDINGSDWRSYVPGAVLVGVFLVFWWKRGTWGRPLLFGLGYFVVTLFPVLGFFDQAFYRLSLVADHWQYYSITGVIALVVAGGEKVCRRTGKQHRYWGTVAGTIVVLVSGGATWKRSAVYQTDETLWRDAVTKNPHASAAHYNLATALQHAGKFNEAVEHYEQALQLKPDYVQAHYNLGDAMLQQGRVQEAIVHYERALQLKPDSAEAHNNLGGVLLGSGNTAGAMAHFEQALQLKPDYAEAHNNLGGVLLRSGNTAGAIAHFEQALRSKPDFAEAHSNLGLALVSLGKAQEGIGHFEQALRIDPDNVEAHRNLGMALARVGRIPEAIGRLDQALRLKPDYAEVHNNLGLILWQSGKTQEAIAHWEKALQIKPDLASSHRRLGDALLQAGKFRDAIEHYDQVLRLEPNSAEVQNRLAWLLATLPQTEGGDPTRAAALAERACALTGHQVPAYLDTLGAAYAAAGQFDEAITSAKKAVELARSEQPELVEQIEARLQLYRGGKSYRQRTYPTIP